VVEALAEMASQDQMENLVGGSNESANEAVAAQLSAFAGNGDSSNGVSIDVAAVAASGPLSDAILTDSYSGMVSERTRHIIEQAESHPLGALSPHNMQYLIKHMNPDQLGAWIEDHMEDIQVVLQQGVADGNRAFEVAAAITTTSANHSVALAKELHQMSEEDLSKFVSALDPSAFASLGSTMMTLVTGKPFAMLGSIKLPDLTPSVAMGSLSNHLKIFITFGQLISIVPANIMVQWPLDFEKFISCFDFMAMDLSFLSYDCISEGRSFYHSFLVSLFLPIVVIVGCGVAWVVRVGSVTGTMANYESRSKEKRDQIKEQHMYWLLFLMYFIHPGITADIFKLYRCEWIYDKYYLAEDLQIVCFEGTHLYMAIAGAAGFVLYVVGIPAAMFWLVYKHRDNLDDEQTQGRYGFLYTQYDAAGGKWDFEFLIIMHKIVITATVVLLRSESSTQVYIAFAISQMFVLYSIHRKPFLDSTEGFMHVCSNLTISATLFVAILLQHQEAQKELAGGVDGYDTYAFGMLLVGISALNMLLFVIMMSIAAHGQYHAVRAMIAEQKGIDKSSLPSCCKPGRDPKEANEEDDDLKKPMEDGDFGEGMFNDCAPTGSISRNRGYNGCLPATEMDTSTTSWFYQPPTPLEQASVELPELDCGGGGRCGARPSPQI